MQNKLYTTIANLFNEIKAARGSSKDLSSAIDKRVKEQPEVVTARQNYNTLDDRISAIQDSSSINTAEIIDVKKRIDNIASEIPPAGPTQEIYNINGDELLINLAGKTVRAQERFNLTSGSRKVIHSIGDDSMIEVFANDVITPMPIKSIEYTDYSQANFDFDKLDLVDKQFINKSYGDEYVLPLGTGYAFYTDKTDSCVIPYIGTVTCDYTQQYTGDSILNNHLVNVLRNRLYTINRSFATIQFNFLREIPLVRIATTFTSNTSFRSVRVDVSNDGLNWTELWTSNGGNMNYMIGTTLSVKYIRFYYNVFDNTQANYQIGINNIELATEHYVQESGVVTTTEPFIINDADGKIKMNALSPVATDTFASTRFAIGAQNGEETNWYTYLPKVRTVLPDDFYDVNGFKCVGDALKNNVQINRARQVILETTTQYLATMPVLQGTLGTVSMTDYNTVTRNDGWKPGAIDIVTISMKIAGVTKAIPLSSANMNKVIQVVFGANTINLRLTSLNTKTLKVYAWDSNNKEIPVDEVVVQVESAFRLAPTSSGSGVVSTWTGAGTITNIDPHTYVSGYPINAMEVKNYYVCQTGHHSFFFYFFDGDTALSGTTETISASIIPSNEVYDISKTVLSTVNNDMTYINTLKRINTKLPVSTYVTVDTGVNLGNLIKTDTKSISDEIMQPLFEYNTEYRTRIFIGDKANLLSILPAQSVIADADIQYSISFDGYRYYTYDFDINKWKEDTAGGMSSRQLALLNDTMYQKLRVGHDLYIKVRMLSPDGSIDNITLNFDSSDLIQLQVTALMERGMRKRELESMTPEIFADLVTKDSPVLFMATETRISQPMYRFALAGFSISNFMDLAWKKIDSAVITSYLLPNGDYVLENITTKPQDVIVVKRVIENQSAIIDHTESLKESVTALTTKESLFEETTGNYFQLLQQQVQLLYDSMISGSTPPPLPDYLLPKLKEIDIPLLQPRSQYIVNDMQEMRGIQLWEQRTGWRTDSEVLLYDTANADRYYKSNVVINTNEAVLLTDYDKDNPYWMDETLTSQDATHLVTPWFTISSSLPVSDSAYYALPYMLDTPSTYSWVWDTTYQFAWWNLPGESVRWVDLIIDFRQLRWIESLRNLWFGSAAKGAPNQITTFAYSVDGNEYINLASYTGVKQGITQTVNKECRYIRIRLEIPYSSNKGAGGVTFHNIDIWHCPLRYVHDTLGCIYNIVPIDTSKWVSITGITVDRFIDHANAEMKFVVSDTPDKSSYKYWDTATNNWITTYTLAMAQAMSIETLLSLKANQLDMLTKGSLYIVAIMNTTDTYRTPALRKVSIQHSNSSETYYAMVDVTTAEMYYSDVTKSLTLINDTDGQKKFKLILL